MKTRRPVYEYKGYGYDYEDDYEDDVTKRFHDCVLYNGKRISIPFSPYMRATEQDFQMWIDLGMPTYAMIGGNILSSADLENLGRRK